MKQFETQRHRELAVHDIRLAIPLLLVPLAMFLGAGFGATPPSAFRVPDGFQVEKIYEVPSEDQGSWVCMTMDLQGRLITSDQYGKLYRVTPAEIGQDASQTKVEVLQTSIGMAQGLLHTKDGLYVDVNGQGPTGGGVYRLQDLDGDDQFEKVDHLVPMSGGGEHGPHAIVEGPDGRLYICAGNATDLPLKIDRWRVPSNWSEDLLLGRMPDSRGFMSDRLAPGGFVISCKPDGSDVELFSTGFRNQYDMAFNANGDLFTYDSDMEWDIGTPWYVPTRVNHVTSGSEFGWRNGTGRWPEYFADSLGAVVNIGYGSPTGVTFATGAKFPAKFENSLLIGDWSYGIVYAVHLQPNGASYQGTSEPFISAAPLPVTDLVVDKKHGGLYLVIGGRKVQSAIYRVSYSGAIGEETKRPQANELTAQNKDEIKNSARLEVDRSIENRNVRQLLEKYHTKDPLEQTAFKSANLQGVIYPSLGSDDRVIRFAARIALEHFPVSAWRSELSLDTKPFAIINKSIALTRCGEDSDQAAIHQALLKLDWAKLSDNERIELIRAYQLTFTRFGESTAETKTMIATQLDHFPVVGSDNSINRELARILVFLDAPNMTERCVQQMKSSGAVDDQIHYAFCLREQTNGWTEASRKDYFQWYFDMASARGGESFSGFIENIRQVAIRKLSEADKAKLGDLVGASPKPKELMAELTPRAMVKEWTVDELVAYADSKKTGFDFQRGKTMFAVAQCYKCHRFSGQGGNQGPDLTASSGRFNSRDMITAIVLPNKEISDQYEATQFLMDDESVITGRVANLRDSILMVATNMLDPSKFTSIDRRAISEIKRSPISPMPSGLLDTLSQDEILDLLAYLRSGGNPDSAIYK